MGTKRSLQEMDPQGDPSGAAWAQMQPAKRTKKFDAKAKHNAKEGTSEYTKKRARNIQRLLKRQQDLPADVRNEMERELAALKTDMVDRLCHKKRSAMISRYHMVRFFERKKASRLVKQLRHQLEANTDPDDVPRLKQELHVAEVDEAYSRYHPHLEPYISMYGNVKTDQDVVGKVSVAKIALVKAEKPPLWKAVEEAMEQGMQALIRLRERRPDVNEGDFQKAKRGLTKPVARLRSPGQQMQAQTRQGPQQAKQDKIAQVQPRERQSKQESGQAGQKQHGKQGKTDNSQPQLNRRERRKQMREAKALEQDEDDDGGGFFEEI
ncbi:hypothetical protein CDD82_2324 [Ophiocordyceps australis]|uniref:rRNA-processing protein EFG1 n=1 Tax=Ophiocordyceps australis TaxID=1399860 RepID=A0A2C5ZIB7_9HYPO|nr:hypothetical protein CDD82_2324 [Ophiocordyceps australis]